jgi:phosphoserine phosphatase RsbX
VETSVTGWRFEHGFECGVAARTYAGETESGDQHVVATFDGGVLVAVIDALGHGQDAACAARIAAGVLSRHAHETPRALVERCHAEMRDTRGAAMSLASFDWRRGTMSWLAVGNVTGALAHADGDTRPRVQLLLQRGGVVGDRLPALRHSIAPVSQGDTLVLATDGMHDEFTDMLPAANEPQSLAQQILDNYGKARDDATVLVFRYYGAP